LEIGLARVAFMRKQWQEAEKIFAGLAQRYADVDVAAEAVYWRAVCHYKATNDHTVLTPAAKELSEKYPGNEWTLKADPWAH
jgi:TolA-binding protein